MHFEETRPDRRLFAFSCPVEFSTFDRNQSLFLMKDAQSTFLEHISVKMTRAHSLGNNRCLPFCMESLVCTRDLGAELS